MADLLSALVQRSKQAADPRALAYASGNRPYLVVITRPGGDSYFDRDTRTMVDLPDLELYRGPARFWTASGPVELQVGGERTTFSSARCSINPPTIQPRVDDVLVVLDDDDGLAERTDMLNRGFAVQDVEVGGHFDTGPVLSLLGVAPSRRSG